MQKGNFSKNVNSPFDQNVQVQDFSNIDIQPYVFWNCFKNYQKKKEERGYREECLTHTQFPPLAKHHQFKRFCNVGFNLSCHIKLGDSKRGNNHEIMMRSGCYEVWGSGLTVAAASTGSSRWMMGVMLSPDQAGCLLQREARLQLSPASCGQASFVRSYG